MRLLSLALVLLVSVPAMAARFSICDYGAAADDQTDDTLAIRRAFDACEEAGGGTVFVPAGTYIISRQKQESPILELPSNLLLNGEGPASILKFDPRVNETNFWRMLGASGKDCRNVVIRNLHLDGSNTHPAYVPGETPEQNHGIFFFRKEGIVENVIIHDCLIENFSGDCIALAYGCRNMTIRNVTLRNFVRQGIQMGGGNGARDYLVTGCQDLEHTVRPGGSTIHVEHARGLKNVVIVANRCRKSILAGGVDGLIIKDNVIEGRFVGNNDSNIIFQGNIVRGVPTEKPQSLVQLGYADGLILKDNVIIGAGPDDPGIYIWGTSRYNPAPSRDVLVAGNLVRVSGRGIFLNGVQTARVTRNVIQSEDASQRLVLKRTTDVQTDVPEQLNNGK